MSEQDRSRAHEKRVTDSKRKAERSSSTASKASVDTAFEAVERSSSPSSVLRLPTAGPSRGRKPPKIVVHGPARGGPLSPGVSKPSTELSDITAMGNLSLGSPSTLTRDEMTGEPLPSQIIKVQVRRRSPPKHSKHKDSVSKQLKQLQDYFDSHNFQNSIEEESEHVIIGKATDTDVRLLLAHAVEAVNKAMQTHKTVMLRAEISQEVIDAEVDISYFDLDDLTERQDVIHYQHLNDTKLEFFEVDEQTVPTIAMLGILKTRIQNFDPQRKPGALGKARREAILRKWVDGWERVVVRHHPVKLYQSHFTTADINYAAVYAKHKYNEAKLTYADLWVSCDEKGLINTTVEAWGCPSPEQLFKREYRPKDLMDFDRFDDRALMKYNWTQESGVPALNNVMGNERKNFRFSISVFARNTKFIDAWAKQLQYSYDEGVGTTSDDSE